VKKQGHFLGGFVCIMQVRVSPFVTHLLTPVDLRTPPWSDQRWAITTSDRERFSALSRQTSDVFGSSAPVEAFSAQPIALAASDRKQSQND
jgi:hypothetical protein